MRTTTAENLIQTEETENSTFSGTEAPAPIHEEEAEAVTPELSREDHLQLCRNLLGHGQPAEALAILERMIVADREDADAIHFSAVALNLMGLRDQSVLLFRRAATLDPTNPSIRQNMILPLLDLERLDDAIVAGREAVRLAPETPGARQNFVLALTRAKRWDEAALAAEEFVALFPQEAAAWTQLGHVRTQTKHYPTAEALLKRAIAINPSYLEAVYNLGVVHQVSLRDEESIPCFRRALELDPAHKGARLNLGVAYRNLGRIEEALKIWRASPVAPQDWPELAYNIACARMLAGEWEEAWADYELRLVTMSGVPGEPVPSSPRWAGEDISGKTLLVIHEQGLGDMVQFIRLLPLIAPKVGKLVFVCQTPIYSLLATHPLFAEDKTGRYMIQPWQGVLPGHDLHISIMSLPHLLRLSHDNVPRRTPYLFADGERARRWANWFGAREGKERPMRIGLAWQGNPTASVERGRSVPLARLAPLFGLQGASFVALHKDVGLEQVEGFAHRGRLAIVADELKDFADTAALIYNLDLVITVDTSIAHVAGAMGRPVWLLNRHVAEWRWGLKGAISPWYPTMRIFRQPAMKDWDGLVRDVSGQLGALLALRQGARLADKAAGGEVRDHAIALHRSGRIAEAVALYRQLVANYPRNGRLYNLLGMALYELGHRRPAAVDQALPIVMHSVALTPDEPDFFSNLSILFDAESQSRERVQALHHALAIAPDHAPSLLALANREIGAKRAQEALVYIERVLKNQGDFANAHSVHASALSQLGRLDEATAAAERAVALEPANSRILVQLGALYSQREEFEKARAAWERAAAANPMNADAWSNLGVDERNRGETGVSGWYSRRAVEVDPNHPEAWCNLGIGTMEIEREAEARAAFRRAIALKPDYADARMALGMSLMNTGDYAEALPLYEYRLLVEKLGIANARPRLPMWQGEDPKGKSFLLLAEQGFGDAFQFSRYAAELKKAGASKVFIGCRKMITAILSSVTGVDGCVAENEPLPKVDYFSYIMSLPLRFNTRIETIPADTPYMKVDPELTAKWAARLAGKPGFRVGLNWQGNPDGHIDKGRSIPLKALKPLSQIPGVRLIALQMKAGVEQIEEVKGEFEVEWLGPEFNAGPNAFLDSAAVMMNLDLIISVDTAAVHLAGALRRPAWVLTKANSEWRWLRERSDSPWYPTTRIFRRVEREPESHEWGGLVARLETELRALVNGDRSRIYEKAMPVVKVPPKPPMEKRFKIALDQHLAGKLVEARAAYAEIINDDPTHAESFHMLGALALQEFAYYRALLFFNEARRLGLRSADLRTNLAIALRNIGRNEEAEAVLREILAEKPTAEALATLGNILRDTDRFEEAVDSFQQSIKLRSNISKSYRGLGNALRDLGRCTESIAAFDAAVKLTPDDPELLLDRSHALLASGDYKAGFEAYEARWQAMEMMPRYFAAPRWDGKATLSGKTLLIHGEQGFGDNMQFCRFAPEIARQAGKAIIEVRRPLLRLIRSMDWSGANVVFAEQGAELPHYDFEVPFMSLPRFVDLDKALPGPVPYFHIPKDFSQTWRSLLPKGLNVGLVWQGNQKARVEKGRSISLATFKPVLDVPGVNFISLQKDYGLEQLAGNEHRSRITVLSRAFEDFADTAGVVSCLDMVISVDTGVAHLAGALGIPTLIAIKYNNDWRWQTVRRDTPWYPQMHVFRQPGPGDWATPVHEMATQLARFAKEARLG